MKRPFHLLALGAAAMSLFGASLALAEGSITLDEVMAQLKDNEKLIAEIGAELKAQGLAAESVICIGARFGGHWTELGGARSVPYECEIGKKTLDIDGTLQLYDERGNAIDMSDERAPERAFDYKQSDLTWKWK